MTSAMLGWQNAIPQAALTATDAVNGLGVANLASDQGSPSRGWQTNAGVTGATVTIDSGAQDTVWRALLLARTNLSAAATVRWLLANPDPVTGLPNYVLDTGTLSAGIVAGIGQTLTVLPFNVTAQTCRFDISDPSNPQGFLNVALAYAGPVWQLAGNIGQDSARGRTDQASITQTRGGQQFALLMSSQRRWEISIPAALSSEEDNVLALDAACRSGSNILFVPDPSSAKVNRETVFGMLSPKADMTFPAPDRRAWKGSIVERL